MTTLTALPPMDLNGLDYDDQVQDESGVLDGVKSLIQSRQNTISSLLLKKITFIQAKSTARAEEIPYKAINDKIFPKPSASVRVSTILPEPRD